MQVFIEYCLKHEARNRLVAASDCTDASQDENRLKIGGAYAHKGKDNDGGHTLDSHQAMCCLHEDPSCVSLESPSPVFIRIRVCTQRPSDDLGNWLEIMVRVH